MKTNHAIVDAIGEMRFTGHIVPHAWWQAPELRFENGKPNSVAVMMLSDIVFFHRPQEITDSLTSQVIEVRKNFPGERMEFNYAKKAAAFGYTERQVREAIGFLHERGIIDRQIEHPSKRIFVVPNVEKIRAITGHDSPRLTSKRESNHVRTGVVKRSNARQRASKRETYKVKDISEESLTKNGSNGGGASSRKAAGDEVAAAINEQNRLTDAKIASLAPAIRQEIERQAQARLGFMGQVGDHKTALAAMKRGVYSQMLDSGQIP